jgi:hypothetical protein
LNKTCVWPSRRRRFLVARDTGRRPAGASFTKEAKDVKTIIFIVINNSLLFTKRGQRLRRAVMKAGTK